MGHEINLSDTGPDFLLLAEERLKEELIALNAYRGNLFQEQLSITVPDEIGF